MDKGKPFHASDLRKGRISISGQTYLITTVTEPLFLDYGLARMVVKAMQFHAQNGTVESLAYVVMPDHLHWLLALEDGGDLCRIMRSVKGFSSHQIAAAVRGSNAAPTGDGATACRSVVLDANSAAATASPHSINDGRTCSIWQPGFHDHALRKEEDLRAVARYLVMNPVRAGLVQSVWQYPLWDAIWMDES